MVDDDRTNLMLTSEALRRHGFEVVEVASGEEALRTLEGWSPDIVVLDAMMPGGIDGFDSCQAIRRMPGFEQVPVLMLTGLNDEASIARAYQVGATDFFVKSNQWNLLAGRLRYLLRAAGTRIELERSKAKLARAQEIARMGSFDWWRAAGRPISSGLELSEQGLRVFGYAVEQRVSLRMVLRLMTPDDRRTLMRLVHQMLARIAVIATDVPMTLPDGRYRIMHVEAEPELDEHGHCRGYTGIVQDVTDRRLAEDRIRHLANYDALTGLPNRRQLIWRAERALDFARRQGHEAALLLIDLDRFKIINDTLGHAAGDELLMEVAQRLRACVRHVDQLFDGAIEMAGSRSHRTLEAVGRLGGDEFVALLPEVGDQEDAERVADRILESLREPVLVSGQECFVTASIGIAIFPRDGHSVADLLRNADVAMYTAKGAGRNASMIYNDHLSGRGREKLVLESALHKALERGELVLYYQPKIDVHASRVVGMEALMRWRRGDQLVQPADFVPLAEETGLIVPMSEWALREAAKQAGEWQRAFGFAGPIAVNLPNRMFERPDLIECIDAAVAAHGVDHHVLQLEITETGLMKDLHKVIPALNRLNEIGVEVSVDDFGSGYSSLSYLTTLPISEVKIDRSFVRELGMTPQSSAVVTAIIALARSLGLRVIAEGVENLRQLEVLHRLGCGLMQGYMFSRPIPAEDVMAWMEQTVLPRRTPWVARVAAGESMDGAAEAGREAR